MSDETKPRGVTRVEITATCDNCRSSEYHRYKSRCRKTGAVWWTGDNPVCGKWMPRASMLGHKVAKLNGTQWEWKPSLEEKVHKEKHE